MSAKNYLGEAGLTELITNCNEELKKKLDLLNLYTESSTKATIDAGDISLSAGADINIIADLKLSVGGEKTYINGDSIEIDAPSTSFNYDVLTILEEKAYYKNEELATLHDLEDYQLQLEEGLSAKQDSLKYYYETETGAVQIYPKTDLLITPKTTCTISAPDGINLGNAVEIDPDKAFYNGYELATQLDISTKQDILTAGTGIAITDSTISCTYSDDISSLKDAVDANTNEIRNLSDSLTDTKNVVSEVENEISNVRQDVADNASSIYSLTESKQDKLTAGTGIDITNNTISCTLDTTVFEIVETLPTSNIDTNKIYVVPAEHTEESNLYAEYIYVNNAWEKLGEFKADTDLSDYYTKSETDGLLDKKADSDKVYDKDYIDNITTEIQGEIGNKQDSLKYYRETNDNAFIETTGTGDILLHSQNGRIVINSSNNNIVLDGYTAINGVLILENGTLQSDTCTILDGEAYYKNAEIATVGDVKSKQDTLNYYKESAGSGDSGYVQISASLVCIGQEDEVQIDNGDITLSSTKLDINVQQDVNITGGLLSFNNSKVLTEDDNIILSTAVQLVVLVSALPSNPDSTTLYLIPE